MELETIEIPVTELRHHDRGGGHIITSSNSIHSSVKPATRTPEVIKETVFENAKRFRNTANGFALGSGNSISDYVPEEGYLAMIESAQKIRENEIL